MKRKRVLAIGDLHCGHHFGLTPPEWQESPKKPRGKLQSLYWDFYAEGVRRLRKHTAIDLLIVNGDAVDGPGKRSGSREQLTTDMLEQVEMALDCIKIVKPKQVVLTFGTPYHVGSDNRTETLLAQWIRKELDVPVKIGSHESINVNGLMFDCKHKIGGSTIPHGRHTAGARTVLWNMVWAKRGQRPMADVFLRSHVHYHVYEGDPTFLAMTLPALQGLGDEYGSTQCEGMVDFGLVWFDVISRHEWTWNSKILSWSQIPEKVVKA
jgi:hypothetical protein